MSKPTQPQPALPKAKPVRRLLADLPFVVKTLALAFTAYVLGGSTGLVVADLHPTKMWYAALVSRVMLLLSALVVSSFRHKGGKGVYWARRLTLAAFVGAPAGLVFAYNLNPQLPAPNTSGWLEGFQFAVLSALVWRFVRSEVLAMPKASKLTKAAKAVKAAA